MSKAQDILEMMQDQAETPKKEAAEFNAAAIAQELIQEMQSSLMYKLQEFEVENPDILASYAQEVKHQIGKLLSGEKR